MKNVLYGEIKVDPIYGCMVRHEAHDGVPTSLRYDKPFTATLDMGLC